MNSTQFPLSLYQLLDFEIYIFLLILCVVCYLFYNFFLKNVSEERHQNLKNHLKNLLGHLLTLSVMYALFFICAEQMDRIIFLKKVGPYLAVLTFLSGCVVFVKASRLMVLQYMFLGSMRAGVPLLLVNIFSLLLSLILGFWSISAIFNVQLTPLVATSAAASIVLGLALQDTLGNLFAGISLQIDKTFEIDDWLEVQNGSVKIIGQVKELSWRSTLLIGFSDERITLPNKLMASSQVSNFSPDGQPIVRSQIFKIKRSNSAEKAKTIIETSVGQIPEIRAAPEPFSFVNEINESWISIKVIYFIDNYGKQFSIGDTVLRFCHENFRKNNIQLANQVIEIASLDQKQIKPHNPTSI